MQLNELGEFGLIGLIREKFASVSAAGYEGIGDDCAVMPCGDGTSLVVTTDMLIEEVHFRLCTTDPYRLGRKSLAVNLSDIAAMGAAPAASFLSIASGHGGRMGRAVFGRLLQLVVRVFRSVARRGHDRFAGEARD